MLKIERLKDIIKNFDTVNSGEDLQCYLSRIATNQNYDDTWYRLLRLLKAVAYGFIRRI